MDMSKYRDLFFSEAREHLAQMSRLLVALEQAPADRQTIDALFREAHSVKGMAASMGYEGAAALAHHLEDALDHVRRGGEVPVALVDRLLAGFDLLEGLIDDLQADRPERDIARFLAGSAGSRSLPEAGPDRMEPPAPPSPGTEPAAVGEPAAAPAGDLPTVSVGRVYQVTVELAVDVAASAARCLLIVRELERAGEILSLTPSRETLRQGEECRRVQAWLRTEVVRSELGRTLRAIAEVRKVTFADDRRTDGGRRSSEAGRSVRVRTELLDQVINLSGELLTQRFMLQRASGARDWSELNGSLTDTARLIEELHHRSLQLRLMPLESITGRLPRLVRDLGQKSGKQVSFRVIGGGVVLDRVILDALADPLVHLVRNAIDHGIAGQGEVVVTARREKDLVLIEVSDNGRGMDPAELRRQVVARNLLSAGQAERLSDREALLLVCLPGFSTARQVTETSGRGVGMDVVKAAVEKLGGTLDIQSTVGEGSRFRLHMPLSMAIIKILLVRCNGLPLAIPLTRVQRTLELPAAAVLEGTPGRAFRLDDAEYALHSLGELLGGASGSGTDGGKDLCVVVIEAPGRPAGLQVDALLGQRDAFVKSLGFPLSRLPGMSGATIAGDGSVMFIVDPYHLLEGGGLPARYQESSHAVL